MARIALYFTDEEPVGPYRLTVPARRTLHQWMSELDDRAPVAKAADYAMLIESNVPIVVQRTGIDTRQ